jgi:hypothetical protein
VQDQERAEKITRPRIQIQFIRQCCMNFMQIPQSFDMPLCPTAGGYRRKAALAF